MATSSTQTRFGVGTESAELRRVLEARSRYTLEQWWRNNLCDVAHSIRSFSTRDVMLATYFATWLKTNIVLVLTMLSALQWDKESVWEIARGQVDGIAMF